MLDACGSLLVRCNGGPDQAPLFVLREAPSVCGIWESGDGDGGQHLMMAKNGLRGWHESSNREAKLGMENKGHLGLRRAGVTSKRGPVHPAEVTHLP